MLITLVFDLNLWGLGFIITYGKIDHPKCRSHSLSRSAFSFFPLPHTCFDGLLSLFPSLPHCVVSPTTAVLCFFCLFLPSNQSTFLPRVCRSGVPVSLSRSSLYLSWPVFLVWTAILNTGAEIWRQVEEWWLRQFVVWRWKKWRRDFGSSRHPPGGRLVTFEFFPNEHISSEILILQQALRQ